MNLYDMPLFGMLRVKLGWLNERQRVLAENVANATTPDFKARDIKEVGFSEILSRSKAMAGRMRVDESGARVRIGESGLEFETEVMRGAEESPNGNSVNLEQEMMKVAETQMAYQAAVDIYKKGASLLRLAVSGR